MKKLSSKSIFVKLSIRKIFLGIGIIALFVLICEGNDSFIQAGDSENTSGYAWSENIGWVSFNSNTGGGTNYGVNIDFATGDLSGYAWSENIGWVSFNRSDTGNPPTSPFNGGSGPIAKYDSATGKLTGWMRVLANDGGWDGWIKFYNASMDSEGDWHGWAWSDMVVGWLSFNGLEGGGSYKVVTTGLNTSPTVSNLQVAQGDYCATPSHRFSWDYSDPDGDAQDKYQFQVDNNSDFSSPKINRINNNPGVNQQTVIVSVASGEVDKLDYNTTYYWRVKVWDINGADSGWVNGSSFNTETHRYPNIDFDWSPTDPSIEETVQFTDQSNVYGATKSFWSWTFPDGNPATSGSQNPSDIEFVSEGDKSIKLEVTDSDGYSCSLNKILSIEKPLPGWKEVRPWY